MNYDYGWQACVFLHIVQSTSLFSLEPSFRCRPRAHWIRAHSRSLVVYHVRRSYAYVICMSWMIYKVRVWFIFINLYLIAVLIHFCRLTAGQRSAHWRSLHVQMVRYIVIYQHYSCEQCLWLASMCIPSYSAVNVILTPLFSLTLFQMPTPCALDTRSLALTRRLPCT